MVHLNHVEQRVLGVLIEKSLTQPGSYPMTLNALVLGANQKQNREPVVEYGEGEVSAAVGALTHKRLVAQSPPAIGARAVRFEHRVVEVFRWDRREQAIMAELLLRGRQTAGELRTHAGRMTSFNDLESVLATLAALRNYETPFVEELPREPGRSANRFRHLMATGVASEAPVGFSTATGVSPVGETSNAIGVEQAKEPVSLADRVAKLEAEVRAIRASIAELKSQGSAGLDERASGRATLGIRDS